MNKTEGTLKVLSADEVERRIAALPERMNGGLLATAQQPWNHLSPLAAGQRKRSTAPRVLPLIHPSFVDEYTKQRGAPHTLKPNSHVA